MVKVKLLMSHTVLKIQIILMESQQKRNGKTVKICICVCFFSHINKASCHAWARASFPLVFLSFTICADSAVAGRCGAKRKAIIIINIIIKYYYQILLLNINIY